MLLMEDIVLSVIPVGERRVIRTGLLDGFRRLYYFRSFLSCLFTLLTSELRFVCSRHVHLVRVYDPALFLEIEGFFMALDFGLGKFFCKILAIVREESLRVRVSYKSVSATSLSCTLVASG